MGLKNPTESHQDPSLSYADVIRLGLKNQNESNQDSSSSYADDTDYVTDMQTNYSSDLRGFEVDVDGTEYTEKGTEDVEYTVVRDDVTKCSNTKKPTRTKGMTHGRRPYPLNKTKEYKEKEAKQMRMDTLAKKKEAKKVSRAKKRQRREASDV